TWDGKSVLRLLVSQLSDSIESLDSLLFGNARLFSNRGGDLRFGHCFSHSLWSVFCCCLVYVKSRSTWLELNLFSQAVQAENEKFAEKFGIFSLPTYRELDFESRLTKIKLWASSLFRMSSATRSYASCTRAEWVLFTRPSSLAPADSSSGLPSKSSAKIMPTRNSSSRILSERRSWSRI